MGWDFVGDDAACADIGAVSDFDGGDERGVGADEGFGSDFGAQLFVSVIVAGDRSRADIRFGSHRCVADIGQVVDFCACADLAVLDLDEITDMRVCADDGAGAQAGIGADDRACFDSNLLHVAESADIDFVGDFDIQSDHHIRADRHIPANFRIGGEKNRVGVGHRYASQHRFFTQTALHDFFGLRQFDAVVDAQYFIGVYRLDSAEIARAFCQSDTVGEEKFFFARCCRATGRSTATILRRRTT